MSGEAVDEVAARAIQRFGLHSFVPLARYGKNVESSICVRCGYPPDHPVHTQRPVRPPEPGSAA